MSRQRQARRDAVLTLLARRPLTASELATRLLVPVTEMRVLLNQYRQRGFVDVVRAQRPMTYQPAPGRVIVMPKLRAPLSAVALVVCVPTGQGQAW